MKWIFMDKKTRKQYIRALVDKYVSQGYNVAEAWDKVLYQEESAYKKLRKQATR